MIRIKAIPAILISLVLLSGMSCIKKDPIMRISQVLLVPLSPNALPVDFSINNEIFATTVGYSTTVGTVTYSLPYYTITPGSTIIKYNVTGQTTSYASATKELLDDNAYSTFLIDSASKAKLVIVNDDLLKPTPGKVKIRFFHFSPNAPAVDISNAVSGTAIFTNRSFNDQNTNEALQDFIEIDPGTYTFAFKAAGTNTVVYTTAARTLLPDRIYTLAARGFVGGTGNLALGGWIYANLP